MISKEVLIPEMILNLLMTLKKLVINMMMNVFNVITKLTQERI